MTRIGFEFTRNYNNTWRGHNTAGMATFAGARYASLAREITQNSLDARKDGLAEGTPVNLSFDMLKVPRGDFPGGDELGERLDAAHKAMLLQGDKRDQSFFDTAVNAFKQKTLKVLRIVDTNTTGLVGPSEIGTNLYALLKAEGQSLKANADAGGSFGIGKFAPFTLSKVRTVFFSTTYKDDDGKLVRCVQGKANLTSHEIDGVRFDPEGFWGVRENTMPVGGSDLSSIPDWLLPEELENQTGTAIYIVAFNDLNADWRERLAGSIAQNFFYAIKQDHLRVTIGTKHTLSSRTIAKIFDDKDVRGSFKEDRDGLNDFDLARNLLAAADTSTPGYVENTTENTVFGQVRLRVVVDKGLPKKLGVVRNGMLITTAGLPGAKYLNGFKPFVALMTFESQKGNEVLRMIEPPEHNAFEPNRIEDSKERHRVERELKRLGDWVREQLTYFAKDEVRSTVEIDELAELFPDEGVGDNRGTDDNEVDPRGKIRIRSKPLRHRSRKSGDPRDAGGGSGGDAGEDTEGGKNGNGKNSGGGTMPEGGDNEGGNDGNSGETPVGDPVALENIRGVLKSARVRTLHLTPSHSGTLALSLSISGADADEDIDVIRTSVGEVKDGNVILDSVAKNRLSLELELSRAFSGTLKVVAHAV